MISDNSQPNSRMILIGRKKDDDPSILKFNGEFKIEFFRFMGKIIYQSILGSLSWILQLMSLSFVNNLALENSGEKELIF